MPIRVITATSLFDGHDVAINIMRRILQDSGAEVIHLGHNRSVQEVVQAALQEDAHAICISSYQGGHVEYFRYIIDLLREHNALHIKVFGGGGGVIVPDEIKAIEAYGVTKIFSPEDGRQQGLQGIIDLIMKESQLELSTAKAPSKQRNAAATQTIARGITAIENHTIENKPLPDWVAKPLAEPSTAQTPVLGITGTGGAGKSSLVDELLLRFTHDFPEKFVAILSVDPTRRKSGGALLGDRIRMNALNHGRLYMRSLATRTEGGEITPALPQAIAWVKACGFDLVIVETAGIGQADAAIVPLVDNTLYVMTAEFGAPTQLEKIDMLDYADWVAINKFERKGSEDAYRYVTKQLQRNHKAFEKAPAEMPVFGTNAAHFNDDGVTALYLALLESFRTTSGETYTSTFAQPASNTSSANVAIVPAKRLSYLSDIADCIRDYHQESDAQASFAQKQWQLQAAIDEVSESPALRERCNALGDALSTDSKQQLLHYAELKQHYVGDEYVYQIRDNTYRVPLITVSLSGTAIPRVALPSFTNPGDIIRWCRRENAPGFFPYTSGVFPFKRTDEDPTRMFAGEGDAKRTNTRFKYLSKNSEAKRLSTAFDSVTLYGQDPARRPDIYGKVGTSGVSICTLDDMKVLYDGFELCAPNTSVSMTINGPAAILLAFFLNTAIGQQVDKFNADNKRQPNAKELSALRATALASVRGTVQADILKEDQGQNTCIYSTEFSLKLMGDIQEFFIENDIKNFYSVSISGYHIAEAGANPISQLAFTLSNGFTFVEYYLARGMAIDDFAQNLSFFFSLGMDPEYAVINRVARRIWAVAMRERYGANTRSQKLKTHIQTSGRSLHAQEIQFNDIRTTLQALTALYDNCNSLHTNAYDEAVTTPTEESVRRAQAIQLIINRELGLAKNENPLQGAFIIDELTDLVEEAVLAEFESLSDRGGVLGAMETGYQRAKIQEESLYYEHQKVSGEYPIVGVNTFINPHADMESEIAQLELRRATDMEKDSQVERVEAFHKSHAKDAERALDELKQVVLAGGNIFNALMQTVEHCSLGQISQALFEVGGQYRRNM